ncbi:unnamed protein product [Moneuplotes crassus]|uniref:Uncharacterized protein n=1 Tax=Euplotes crassus TaxID=5936 RepID=A0AAD2D503_EUPCR|nr:unnamed protein product [Moneuplotes crassus]
MGFFFHSGFRKSFKGTSFRFNNFRYSTHLPTMQKQMISNFMKAQAALPATTGQLMMMSINNRLMLENIIKSNLDELEDNVLLAENEDLEEVTVADTLTLSRISRVISED